MRHNNDIVFAWRERGDKRVIMISNFEKRKKFLRLYIYELILIM